MVEENTIDLAKIFSILIKKKKVIFVFILLSSIISVGFALLLPNYYKSEALLEAVNSSSDESMGLGDLGGLASMAGVNIGGPGGGTQAELAIAITKSRDFFNSIIEKYDFILPAIMAVDSYDHSKQEIIYDIKKYNPKNKKWNESPSLFSKRKPTNQEAYREYIGKVYKISRNNKTGYLMMSVEHKSPKFANQLLKIIINETNEKSRQQALVGSSKSLKFLKEEASINKVNEINESISSLIEAQLQTQMMAKVHEDYLLKILDSPYIPERKSKPQRAIICIIGVILGFFASIIYILTTSFLLNKEDTYLKE